MILVAFRHGLRSSELVDLRWDQIDFTHAVLHVRRAKKGTPATHPVVGDEMRALRRLQLYTAESIRVLASIMRQPEHSDAARIQAANILLDRGWGKPPQAHTGEGDGDIRISIRQIIERGNEN